MCIFMLPTICIDRKYSFNIITAPMNRKLVKHERMTD